MAHNDGVDAEQQRLKTAGDKWRTWGPYLSERAWGTVREDYSADGDAWNFFPYDHARSRTYRWSEDGLAGISDDHQYLCFAFAFWNGKDPWLKERIFGLTGEQANHGEDAKEYWWYDDCTPTHSWMRWRYAYPQTEFPYQRLLSENQGRSKDLGEFELMDTGVFDNDEYWDISVEYAKATPEDICVRLQARNAGPTSATLHVLPTLWARNTWSWDGDMGDKPRLTLGAANTIVAEHSRAGSWELTGVDANAVLFCENETNSERLWGQPNQTAYPKDAINDYVVEGNPRAVNPNQTGTKAALHYILDVEEGETAQIQLRFRRRDAAIEETDIEAVVQQRQEEADAFYNAIAPNSPAEDHQIMRQALSGMLWSKQIYHYNVERWLNGDPAFPTPPPERLVGRNATWKHLDNIDVVSMPDKWEYPWYAAWDLAFHCVALAHVDVDFAKGQLLLMLREWYMHPNGQLPAYEWNFSDVNPPVHGWAALRVFHIDGSQDFAFLERVFHKLVLNFNWWVNRKDEEGDNVFEGGFLGLDNISPIDRSKPLPVDGHLEQADGTAWMANYCLSLLEMALTLAANNPTYEDMATKFFEHFAAIARAMDSQNVWDEADGFYYDMIKYSSGERVPLRVRSTVGLLPLLAVTSLDPETAATLPAFTERMHWFLENKPDYADVIGHVRAAGKHDRHLLSVVSPTKLDRLLKCMLDEDEFLSEYGLRSVSKHHANEPFLLELAGQQFTVDYEPAESKSWLFGGNSNWRGPIWFPTNYLLIGALRRFDCFFGDTYKVHDPTDSASTRSLGAVADDLSDRLINIYRTRNNRRAVFGSIQKFQTDPVWRDRLLFHEYFHGDNGAGLGASHQTGWTGLIADLIIERDKHRAASK